jgi:hypothetical protein
MLSGLVIKQPDALPSISAWTWHSPDSYVLAWREMHQRERDQLHWRKARFSIELNTT